MKDIIFMDSERFLCIKHTKTIIHIRRRKSEKKNTQKTLYTDAHVCFMEIDYIYK